jgi:hypothetical protein
MILWLSYYEIIKHTTFYVLLTCIKKVYCQTLKNAIIRLELKGRYIHRITLYNETLAVEKTLQWILFQIDGWIKAIVITSLPNTLLSIF